MDPLHLVEHCHPKQVSSCPKSRGSTLLRLKHTNQGHISHSRRCSASPKLCQYPLNRQSHCPSPSQKSMHCSCPTLKSLKTWMDPYDEQVMQACESRTRKRRIMGQTDNHHGIGAELLMRGEPLRGRGLVSTSTCGSSEKVYQ